MSSLYAYKVIQDTVEIKPFAKDHVIPIVVTTDGKFVPYTGVTLYSLIKNSSRDYHYDIVIIHDGSLSKHDRVRLFNLSHELDHISIRFCDISPKLKDLHLVSKLSHVTKATFYRYFIPDIMQEYGKVVYLDTDVVVRKDIAEMYRIDMGDNYLAGCHDIIVMQIMAGEGEDYFRNILHMDHPQDQYMQAGILMFNCPLMRKDNISSKMLHEASKGIYCFSGQDPMNIVCRGKIHFLPLTWNFTNFIRSSWSLWNIPPKYRKIFSETSKDPAIIHYASHEKPWNRHNTYLAEVWWQFARETVFYEEILYPRKELELITQNIRNAFFYTRDYISYKRCKIMSFLTMGRRRKHYLAKRQKLKFKLRQTLNFMHKNR